MYDIFLDDERFPSYKTDRDIIICRNANEFRDCIKNNGWPTQIHLDHDLGEDEDGSDIMKWFYNYVLDNSDGQNIEIEFFIHSQNPIGRKRMEGYISDIQKFLLLRDELSKKPSL